MDEQTANNLKAQIQLPKFMEDIFELSANERQKDAVGIKKRINDAKLIPDERTKRYALEKISEDLVRVRDIDRAIDVADLIPDESMRRLILKRLLKRNRS